MVYKTVGGDFDVVFVSDLLRYFRGVDSHLLLIGHVGNEIEFLDFDAEVASTKLDVGDGAVYVEFFV